MAEREAYLPPQFSSAQDRDDNSTSAGDDDANYDNDNATANQASTAGNKPQLPMTRAYGPRGEYNTPDKKVHYICGDCGKSQGFEANDPIRCAKCGCRTMYKARVKQLAQFQAC